MRRAYQVEAIRYAEAEAMARLPIGALMQRAAAGLATVAARILRESGGIYGSRVVLLVASGTTAATRCSRGDAGPPGRAGGRVLMDPGTGHEGGLRRRGSGRANRCAAVDMTVSDAADLESLTAAGSGGKVRVDRRRSSSRRPGLRRADPRRRPAERDRRRHGRWAGDDRPRRTSP